MQEVSRPVRSEHVQQFNGTARPVHRAVVAVMVGLSSLTTPAVEFAAAQGLVLLGREQLKRWAGGDHLYDVVGVGTTG